MVKRPWKSYYKRRLNEIWKKAFDADDQEMLDLAEIGFNILGEHGP